MKKSVTQEGSRGNAIRLGPDVEVMKRKCGEGQVSARRDVRAEEGGGL